MQYAPALKVLHRIQAKFSLAAPLKSVLVCASVGRFSFCWFVVFFFLEELTSCYVHFIFKGNISKGLLVPLLSSQRSSCKYQCNSVDFRISLLTPAKGGQAKQNIIFCVLFSFLYFAPPKHSFGDIWHFARKSSCKESLPSDVCKILSSSLRPISV